MNVYRTQVVEEILSTEENYVTTLRDVVDVRSPIVRYKRSACELQLCYGAVLCSTL